MGASPTPWKGVHNRLQERLEMESTPDKTKNLDNEEWEI